MNNNGEEGGGAKLLLFPHGRQWLKAFRERVHGVLEHVRLRTANDNLSIETEKRAQKFSQKGSELLDALSDMDGKAETLALLWKDFIEESVLLRQAVDQNPGARGIIDSFVKELEARIQQEFPGGLVVDENR